MSFAARTLRVFVVGSVSLFAQSVSAFAERVTIASSFPPTSPSDAGFDTFKDKKTDQGGKNQL
jgi:hypothetical protein